MIVIILIAVIAGAIVFRMAVSLGSGDMTGNIVYDVDHVGGFFKNIENKINEGFDEGMERPGEDRGGFLW